jgi:hypothetical protein
MFAVEAADSDAHAASSMAKPSRTSLLIARDDDDSALLSRKSKCDSVPAVTNDIALPDLPARPVRPVLCT